MTHLEQQPYNMPSIEHNGEQWIRLVDHVELLRRDHQAAIEECVRKIESYFAGLIVIPDPQATKTNLISTLKADK
jgi:predicted secreted Zn-dependent protease